MRRRALIALSAATLLGGCLDLNFDAESIVKGPRMLAISANPPEALFGEDIRFETLVVDAEANDLTVQPGIEVRWTVCLGLGEVFDAAGLGSSSGLADGCPDGAGLIVLESDGAPSRAILPGALLTDVISMIPMGSPDEPPPDPMIPGLDPMVLQTLVEVLAEVGIPLTVRVEVTRDGERLLGGFKRFAITTRSGATINPPPPRLLIGDVEVSARARGGDPHVCVSRDGSLPTAAVGAEVRLAPDANEAWIETYPVFDLSGQIITNSESAYYSWFSTAGAFTDEVSRRPNRDSGWVAPEVPGTYPLIVVVRDGHLGLSWCRASIRVE